jgi:hypothetical protein
MKMEFGQDKSWTLNIRHGKVGLQGFKTRHSDILEPMNETDSCKHLGILYFNLEKFNTLRLGATNNCNDQ